MPCFHICFHICFHELSCHLKGSLPSAAKGQVCRRLWRHADLPLGDPDLADSDPTDPKAATAALAEAEAGQ